MRVLILYLIRKRSEVGAHNFFGAEFGSLKAADDVLEGGSNYKVFLLQTELLPLKELQQSKEVYVYMCACVC